MNEFWLSLALSFANPFAPAPEVTLLYAGDAMQHIAQVKAAKRVGDTFSYSECFEEIKEYVSSADYSVVNFETTLGGKPYTGYPCFSSPTEFAISLKDAGFDLFLNANNHTLDRRDKGLKRTINILDSLNISHIGTYLNKQDREGNVPFIKEINGYKISFLNYTYGTNGISPKDVVVNYIDTIQIKKDIELSRKKGAEILSVQIHWGDEYKLLPNKNQKKIADFLVNQGVDLIIGGHPHVIQPMEICYSEKYCKDCLIVYSLGNFISDMKTSDTRGGVLAKVVLSRDRMGKVKIKSANYSLVFTLPSDGKSNYKVVPIEEVQSGYRKIQAENFEKSAEKIFTKYNKNVSREPAKVK